MKILPGANTEPNLKIGFPGFLDMQANGFGGVDFNNPSVSAEDVSGAIHALRATGVTRLLPTLITSSFERFAKCARTLANVRLPEIVGIHMEGPYICAEAGARGAHPREHVIGASIDDFARRQEAAGGQIRLVTLAPEAPGAFELIEHLIAHGIRVAIGHTAASPEQIRDAVKAGATLSTHLGNGCAPSLPRHPNFIWEQLAADDLFASLIVDGHHLPPATVKVMVRAKGTERVFLVTDATAAAGSSAGAYELNGERVVLSEDGRVSPPGKPWLAGSALTMCQAVANTVKFTGLPLETVLPMASTQPAKYLNVETVGTVTADWDSVNYRLSNIHVSGV
ncbi:MAG: N-acetylglucosamine-6-phosphate deacetylase [Limisphaerales bacterium]